MKTRRKGVLTYVIIWALFLLYLFMSTKIVMLFVPESELLKTASNDVYYSTQKPIFAFDVKPEYCAGFYEYVYISAWAFCETEYDNSNKTTGIVLRNVDNDKSYIFETTPDKRLDVYNAYKTTKNIYNEKVSLDSKFSTLNLPYGIYELYVRVVENQMDFGTVSTGMYFEKQADNFIQVDKKGNEITYTSSGDVIAREAEIDLENYSAKGNWVIDSAKKTDSYMIITGWASYSPETNPEQDIICAVTFEDSSIKYYTTQKIIRSDVATHFGDESYSNCGFKTVIPLEDDKEMYSLSLIAEIDGKYYPIAFDAKIIQETDSIELSLSEETEEGLAYIDKSSFGDGVVKVSGWASYSAETNADQKVYVGLTDSTGTTKYYAAKSSSRSDVAKAKGDSYLNCGYSAEIRLLNLETEYTVSIVIQVGDEFYPINIKNSRVIKRQ